MITDKCPVCGKPASMRKTKYVDGKEELWVSFDNGKTWRMVDDVSG